MEEKDASIEKTRVRGLMLFTEKEIRNPQKGGADREQAI